MEKTKFFYCRHCGNIIAYLLDSGVAVECCGEAMQELVPNSKEASTEKHLPVITCEGNRVTVSVGSVEHPMTDNHYIQWICLATTNGKQRRVLSPKDSPKCEFLLSDNETPTAAYAYCNLHGLWVTEL